MGVSRAVMGVKEGREKATTTTTTMVKGASRVVEVTSSKVVVTASRVVVMVVATRGCCNLVVQQSSADLGCVSNDYQPFFLCKVVLYTVCQSCSVKLPFASRSNSA